MAVATAIPKNMNTITGKVTLKGSGIGIEGLVVEVYDMEAGTQPGTSSSSPGDRLGSVLTGFDGSFKINYDDADYRVQNNTRKRPDLHLVVLAPDDADIDSEAKILYKSSSRRRNAGRIESYLIKLTKAQLENAGIDIPNNPEEESVEDKINNYREEKDSQKKLREEISKINKADVESKISRRKENRKKFIDTWAKKFVKTPLNGEMVNEGESIRESNKTVAESAIERANDAIKSGKGVPVNLYLTPADKQRLSRYFLPEKLIEGMAVIPEAEIRDILFRINSSENPGTLLVHNNPIAGVFTQNSAEEKNAMILTGLMEDTGNGETIPPAGITLPAGVIPPVTGSVINNGDIPKYIDRLVNTMPSPDEVLNPDLRNARANKTDIEKNVSDFYLTKGPAEVAAYYDLPYLEVAFEHVWKQLFDEDIIQAAHEVNEGFRNVAGFEIPGPERPDELVLALPDSAHDALAGLFSVPPYVASQFDITDEEWALLDQGLRDKLKNLSKQIREHFKDPKNSLFVQELRDQGEMIIDRVRLDDYSSLHKTLRDLKERLTGNFEFTIYAADKNFHYVNFGLLNTYRQQWTPLNYQAGKLIKTMPLSPKEERKYSLKITRNEKRSVKEARKNSSSFTSEQSSTSRVESEIMKKAMNKSNFTLAGEVGYEGTVVKGKVSTGFGIEAQNDSSENRKDFRESVLKATQEYKEELSIEINTEQNSSYEYNESGTIVNPNDELAVTYLFYELQRRYRLSEQLYRVMPVVLVAQEVPSPDKITEAWVITHDWIINRNLLDNSFRSALQYLSQKSVGDDFAVRELRKNLRQQRSLVETLQMELTKANNDAENRYSALFNKVQARIDEEEAENSDGAGSDWEDFWGGGGQNPEAAKARELAAKDEHQYAVEKAGKVAASLRQEVNALHNLTNEFNKTMQDHLDNETRIKRLLVHIRNNILYYMQCIWKMEPPDQRFLRLHHVQVAVLELGEMKHPADDTISSPRFYFVDPEISDDIFRDFREKELNEDGTVRAYTEKHKAFLQGTLKPLSELAEPFKPLVQVADLDNLLGFKGNYMMFPLKEHNALTEFMAAPFVDSAFGAMDPDELSNVNLDEYSKYICHLHDTLTEVQFNDMKPMLLKWLQLLLADPLRNGDEITVPTDSLFIEALPATHSLLEDFKLRHRILDVYKVQAEVRKAELENIRYAARLLSDEMGDPDVEKNILVNGNGVNAHIDVEN